jgi:hypothetical protein
VPRATTATWLASWRGCIYDAAKAKASLEKAGGYEGPLTLAYNADGGHKEWVDAACVSIKNTLGIDCQGKPYPEFGPFREAVTTKSMTGMFRRLAGRLPVDPELLVRCTPLAHRRTT